MRASVSTVIRTFSISHNRWITKLEAGLEPETTVETTKNPPDCVSQNGRTKSKKARSVAVGPQPILTKSCYTIFNCRDALKKLTAGPHTGDAFRFTTAGVL